MAASKLQAPLASGATNANRERVLLISFLMSTSEPTARLDNNEMKRMKPAMATMPRSSLLISMLDGPWRFTGNPNS
jgi:hypothetical protein